MYSIKIPPHYPSYLYFIKDSQVVESGLSGKRSDRISKRALTKTIKTPNCIFRKQSMLCFL
ncbi:hypothetical protein, partial [Prevotella sp.]|uniref:hypothetical protein n=1 Tax=Prevotella sp. TaxID=59823 RepID=UPI003AB9AF2D